MKKSSLFNKNLLTVYLLKVLTGALLPLPEEEDEELEGVLGV
jgi:hypothetical protein